MEKENQREMWAERHCPQGAYFDRSPCQSAVSSSYLLDQEAVAVGRQRSPVSTHISARPFSS